MKEIFLTVCVGFVTSSTQLCSLSQALENEDDATFLLQTSHATILHSEMHHRYEETPKSLDYIKSCLSQIADSKEVVEQDVKISDTELKSLVRKVKACAGDAGMMEEEYLHFMKYVRDHAPQKLLVWGLGVDSIILNLLNHGGDTVFLEPDPQWIKALQQSTPGQALHVVSFDETMFNTTVSTYQEFLLSPHRADTVGPLQGQPCWDTVLIDSPTGGISTPTLSTGRAVPMYTAFADVERCKSEGRYPANAEVTVFVHDCNRPLEDDVSKAYLTEEKLQHEIGPKKLRQFCLTCPGIGTQIDKLESITNELSASLNVDLQNQGAVG